MFTEEKTDFPAYSNQNPNTSGESFSNKKTLTELRQLFFETADEILQLASDLKGQIGQRNIAKEKNLLIIDHATTSSENIINNLSLQVRSRYRDLLSIELQLGDLSEGFATNQQSIRSRIDKVKKVIIPLIGN